MSDQKSDQIVNFFFELIALMDFIYDLSRNATLDNR